MTEFATKDFAPSAPTTKTAITAALARTTSVFFAKRTGTAPTDLSAQMKIFASSASLTASARTEDHVSGKKPFIFVRLIKLI